MNPHRNKVPPYTYKLPEKHQVLKSSLKSLPAVSHYDLNAVIVCQHRNNSNEIYDVRYMQEIVNRISQKRAKYFHMVDGAVHGSAQTLQLGL